MLADDFTNDKGMERLGKIRIEFADRREFPQTGDLRGFPAEIARRQPVAIDAALVRVVDGKTLVWLANCAERCPNSLRNGASRGVIKSALRLSQMTMTARFILISRLRGNGHSVFMDSGLVGCAHAPE